MTVLATDTFDRTDGGLGSNWTAYYAGGGGTIVSNEAKAGVSTDSRGSYYNAVSFPDDQYSKITIGGTLGSGDFWSVGVRLSGGTTTDGYYCSADSANWYITRFDNGTGTDIANNVSTFAVGDVVECRAVGSLISLYKNGSLVGSKTDATYTTGAAGLGWYNNNVTATTWEGGDFSSGAIVTTAWIRG